MINLIDDISKLTDVPCKTLNKFVPIANHCIGHAVHESYCSQSDITEIDLGYGELHIKVDASGIRYRFIPSKELETLLVKTITTKRSPIIEKVEKDLQEKIERAYKELLWVKR